MMSVYVAIVLTVAVAICEQYNNEWNYFFGVMFFAGFPFAALLEDGVAVALWGYSFGVAILVGLTVFMYLLEYQQTGNWEMSV